MGSTNKTTNYELSQFVGTDKPSWLGDYNADMSKIDLAIKARAVEAGQAQASADTANGKADALDTRMDTAEDNILALQNASTTDHAQIATNTGNISQNAQDIVQLDAKIGHTQITIGDHTVTGAIAVLAGQGGVEADNVSYDNTQSGLTADNVQEAIDELAARPTIADASDVTFDNTGTTLQATNVEDAIKEVATVPASNVRWNSTTDRFEVLKNGSWTQSIRAFVNKIAVWVNGVFNLSHETDVQPSATAGFTLASEYSVSGNNIVISPIDANDYAAGIIFESVDFTDYTTVTIKTNIPGYETLQLDVSGATGTGYLYFCNSMSSNVGKIIICGISTIDTTGYSADIYKQANTTRLAFTVSSFIGLHITEITIE